MATFEAGELLLVAGPDDAVNAQSTTAGEMNRRILRNIILHRKKGAAVGKSDRPRVPRTLKSANKKIPSRHAGRLGFGKAGGQ
jgi:hypothetical protein